MIIMIMCITVSSKKISFCLISFVFFTNCQVFRSEKSQHFDRVNCSLNTLIKTEYKDSIISFDKALILRDRFCSNELCSDKLYESMEQYIKNENKRVLVITDSRDTLLIALLSKHKNVTLKVDYFQSYLRYGFQRPGHYAFLFNENNCPTQYINITQSFLLWFVKQ